MQQAALPPTPAPVTAPAPIRLPDAPKTLPGPKKRIAIADVRAMLNAMKTAPQAPPSMPVTTRPPQVVAAAPQPVVAEKQPTPVMADRTQVAMASPSVNEKSLSMDDTARATVDKPVETFSAQATRRVDTAPEPPTAPLPSSDTTNGAAAPTAARNTDSVPHAMTAKSATIPATPQLPLTVDAPAQGAFVFRARDEQATLTVIPMPSGGPEKMRGVTKDTTPAREARVERATLPNGGMVLATVFTRSTAEPYYLIVPDNGTRRKQVTLRAGKQAVLPVLRDIANAAGQLILCPGRFAEGDATLAATTAAPLDTLRKLATQAHYTLQGDGPVVTVTPE